VTYPNLNNNKYKKLFLEPISSAEQFKEFCSFMFPDKKLNHELLNKIYVVSGPSYRNIINVISKHLADLDTLIVKPQKIDFPSLRNTYIPYDVIKNFYVILAFISGKLPEQYDILKDPWDEILSISYNDLSQLLSEFNVDIDESVAQLVDANLLIEHLESYRISYPRYLIEFKTSQMGDLTIETMVALQPLGARSLGHIVEKILVKHVAKTDGILFNDRKITFNKSTTSNALIFNKNNISEIENEYLELSDEKGLDAICFNVSDNTAIAKKALQVKFYAKTVITNSLIAQFISSMQKDANRWDTYFMNNGIKVDWDSCIFQLWCFGDLQAEDVTKLKITIKRNKCAKKITFFGSKQFVDEGLPMIHKNFIYNLGKEVYPYLYNKK